MKAETDVRSMRGEVVDPDPDLEPQDSRPRTLDPHPERQSTDHGAKPSDMFSFSSGAQQQRPSSSRTEPAQPRRPSTPLSPEARRTVGRSQSSRRRMRRLRRESEAVFDVDFTPGEGDGEPDDFGKRKKR